MATTPESITDHSEEPFVRITLKDIYREVVQLREEVSPLIKQVPDHEGRIRTVERWAYALPPAFIMSVASLVLAWRKS